MQKGAGAAAGLAFIAILPGFFVYHYLVGVEAIPMFAGGWASIANLVACLVLAPLTLLVALRSGVSLHAPFVAFSLLILGYAAYYWRYGADYQRDPELLVLAIKLVLGLVALYCVGFLATDAPWVKRALVAVLVLMAGLTLLYTDWSALTFTIPEREVPSGKVSDYQGFATALAVTAVLAVAVVRNLPGLLALIVASSAALFLIGARGDMIGFGLAIGALTVLALSRREFGRALLVAVAYGGTIAILLLGPELLAARPVPVTPPVVVTPHAPAPEAPRPAAPLPAAPAVVPPPVVAPPDPVGSFRNQELLEVTESQTFGVRVDTLRSGWAGIKASPIFGDYAGQVRDKGAFGWYIHNGLSAWQQFGLPGFLLYAGLSLFAVGFSAWRVLVKGDSSFLMLATLLVSTYSVGLIILTKSVFWPLPAFAWGLAVARYQGSMR